MILKLLYASWRRSPRRKMLAVFTVFLAASLLSTLLSISLDIGDKMARELKSYGANILIQPAEQAVLPSLFGDSDDNPLAGESSLDEKELPNVMDIFWRNNIVGFAPLLSGTVSHQDQKIHIVGTFFDQHLPLSDDENFHTGQQVISPFWHVDGEWPQDNALEALVGSELARHNGWGVGTTLTLQNTDIRISGILTSGSDEEAALIVPLHLAQQWLERPGKIDAVRVSAMAVPENTLSKKANRDPDSLDAESFDKWYCTAYVSAIAHQLEEVISGSIVRPIWQVAESEGIIIGKIQWLLLMATAAALAAAAMGIASLMTSNLVERAKEIGLMKALGAHNWQVELLFYLEACLSSLLGGLSGCLAGWGLARIIGRQLFGIPLDFSWITLPSVLFISLSIALIGTWFPAHRIARLYPIEVLYGRK